MTLLWIRHGETALNAARVLQPPQTPLSPRGERQAQAVAARLARRGVVGVLSSDLPRALQTAQAIARACGVALQATATLQERNFGALRGLPYDGLGVDPLTMAEAPPQGESMAAFEQRVGDALAEAAAWQARLGGPVAVVSHGLVIRTLLQRWVTRPPGLLPPARIGNTAVTEIAAQPPHAVIAIACTAHLAADDDDAAGLSGG